MKKTLLLTSLGMAVALPATAATFVSGGWAGLGAGSPATTTASGSSDTQTAMVTQSVDGITATLQGFDSNADADGLQLRRFDFNGVGVFNTSTDETNGNDNQAGRIGTTQYLTLSFDTTVRIDLINFNNLISTNTGTEIAVLSASSFTGLNYDATGGTFTSQTGTTVSEWGYESGTGTFNIQSPGANNFTNTVRFGLDGYDSLILNAGDTLTLATDTSDGLATQGGWALTDIEVTAVPEPSSTALIGLAGLGFILRRRR
ncbi:PEP-CTERM protein-sorting domain-containing protein [Rubritalea squalenifaciens DSM 18772]|uniref:PEP-CTERM protein-sorting domain-containing protein n=1 Tax=Rubritalea squalenifaciens DSM 18772 TaxID=1123071 RepID=A0A1M6SA19_9BACT|nr:PEP-CTERM sorting domain-containing protein [Rubritalea squalenifaciens]SHK41516.1 PEP-CTERM protein-sorting domain-containing protein [Rubritalea squalenifaciens DSM 18772]